MNQLYFVRHGESEANASNIWSPYDSPLTDLGRWQASAAGTDASQRGLHFDVIISSPQPRAHETARIIANELDHQKPIELLPLLVERDWGTLAGVKHHLFLSDGRTHKDLDNLEGTEHLAALQKRASDALSMFHARHEQSILIVGHGTFGRALVREIAGLPFTKEYEQPIAEQRLPNARILHLYPEESF